MILLHRLLQRFTQGISRTGNAAFSVPHESASRGFSLLELAIVVAIGGVMSAGGMVMYNNYVREKAVTVTEAKSDKVLDAVSVFVQRYNRLPCPADPADFGTADEGSENFPIAGTSCFNTQNDTLVGVLPWRTLGLSRDDAKDSWGRFFTYKPSPYLTIDTIAAAVNVADVNQNAVIHAACRTPGWYSDPATGGPEHINKAKAMFCCNAKPPEAYVTSLGLPTTYASTYGLNKKASFFGLDQDGGVVVKSEANNELVDKKPVGVGVDYFGGFEKIQGLNDAGAMPADGTMLRTQNVALTLVSHGANGNFAINNNGAQLPGDPTNAAEQMNSAGNTLGSAYNPRVSKGALDKLGNRAGAADDIVIMMRPDQIYSRVGQASCIKPAQLSMSDLDMCDVNPSMCTCPSDPSECPVICDDASGTPCSGSCSKAVPTTSTRCSEFYSGYTTQNVTSVVPNMAGTGLVISCPGVPDITLNWERFERASVASVLPGQLAAYDSAPGACPLNGCSPIPLAWTDPGNSGAQCDGTFATSVAHGATVTITDNAGLGSGTATYQCDNGNLTLQTGHTCGCSEQAVVQWSDGDPTGTNCRGDGASPQLPVFFVPTTAPTGSHATIEDNTTGATPMTGEAEYNCQFDPGVNNVRWTFVCGSCS